MQETDDIELLRQYANGGSEEAFTRLVARQVNLVYSVALRHTTNAHAAEEITQAVFLILARKARRLRPGTILSGWLYQTARLTAANYLRTEIRRTRREQEAYMQSLSDESQPNVWLQIAPLLDAAMGQLSEKDRNAIVLRYFENKSLSEVGSALGASEDAAKMRINRALDRLRKLFSKRGVVLTTAVIAGAASVHSVQAAPAGLTAAVAATAVKGAAVSNSTLTLIKGTLKLMAWTKAKTALAVGAGVLLSTGTATLVVKEIQEHGTYSWQISPANFDVLRRTPSQTVIVATKFREDGGWVGEDDRVLGIAQPIEEIARCAFRGKKLQTIIVGDLPSGRYDFISNLPRGEGSGKALQAELKRKFGVTGMRERRDVDVLQLRVKRLNAENLKPGTHLKPDTNPRSSIAVVQGKGRFTTYNQPLFTLTGMLENHFQIPVVDHTDLTGSYDLALQWDEPDHKHPNLAGLKQSLLNQLGLELVPAREPVEMLVIECAKD